MTTSLNTPAPEQSRDLRDAIDTCARRLALASERQARAWDNLDGAIESGKPVKELDTLEQIAVRWSVVQSKAWHRLDEAKAALLAEQN